MDSKDYYGNIPWIHQKAWDWYHAQPWIRGYCGYPANAVNRIAMWQKYEHEKIFEQIDKEFELAKRTGFNAVRAVIQFDVWYYEHESFMAHLEEYFSLAWKHGLKVMLVLGNDCTVAKSRWKPAVFGEQKIDWGYHSGIKGGQHAGDYKEPGYQLLDDPIFEPKYYEMVDELAGKYGQDDRLQIWDVWNEPGNSNRDDMSLHAMEKFFEILRKNRVQQPLTADVWSSAFKPKAIEKRAMELSDIITFHYYGSFDNMIRVIEQLKKYKRPLICNEWFNRLENNNIEQLFPLFYLEKIGSYCWGLMQGYSQTFEPWGIYYLRQSQGEKLDLVKWQHDFYRFNGLPYIPEEIEIIKKFCAYADQRDCEKADRMMNVIGNDGE